tara:strand:- start:92728 stop:93714 length:987 start_codon:yes stop_codon:yes gene_type:complete
MLITQKYHSAFEIDPEFIPSLEELLKDKIPSFEWIKFQEEKTPEDVHFAYYLFFGNEHNSPVGYAQACIHNKESHGSFLGKFLGHAKREKSLIWSMFGENFQGVIFEPKYSKEGLENAKSLIREYNEREDINFHFLKIEKKDHDQLNDLSPIKTQTEVLVDGLIKNQDSYQDYLNALSPAIQKNIKSLWKDLYQKPGFKFGNYNQFKSCFSYKSKGLEQYNEFKNNNRVQIYIKFCENFFTLETDEEVKAIIYFIEGKANHVFCDFIALDRDLDKDLLIQASILSFYENRDWSHLHFLNQTRDYNRFKDLGVRTKTQECLTFKSHDHF